MKWIFNLLCGVCSLWIMNYKRASLFPKWISNSHHLYLSITLHSLSTIEPPPVEIWNGDCKSLALHLNYYSTQKTLYRVGNRNGEPPPKIERDWLDNHETISSHKSSRTQQLIRR
jgi:hypothetical protein